MSFGSSFAKWRNGPDLREGSSMRSLVHSIFSVRRDLVSFYVLFVLFFPLVLVAEGLTHLASGVLVGGKEQALSIGFNEVREKVCVALSYALTP
jgi:hypothetical protein